MFLSFFCGLYISANFLSEILDNFGELLSIFSRIISVLFFIIKTVGFTNNTNVKIKF